MTKEYIESKGWVLSGYMNGNNQYIHKDYNITDDNFYLKLRTYHNYGLDIKEHNNQHDDFTLFEGTVKTEGDLDYITKLLKYNY